MSTDRHVVVLRHVAAGAHVQPGHGAAVVQHGERPALHAGFSALNRLVAGAGCLVVLWAEMGLLNDVW